EPCIQQPVVVRSILEQFVTHEPYGAVTICENAKASAVADVQLTLPRRKPDPAGDDVRARRRSGCPQPFDEILRWFVAVLQPQDEDAVAFGSRWSRWFTLHDLR